MTTIAAPEPTPAVRPSEPAEKPAPPAAEEPAPPQPEPAPDEETRPGFGRGDENHVHTGPPGHDDDHGRGHGR